MVTSPSLIPGDTGEVDTEGGVHEAPLFYFTSRLAVIGQHYMINAWMKENMI